MFKLFRLFKLFNKFFILFILFIYSNVIIASVWWGNTRQLIDGTTLLNILNLNIDPEPFTSVTNSNNQTVRNYAADNNNARQAKINSTQRWHGNPNHLTIYLQSVINNWYRTEDYSCHVHSNQTNNDTCN